MQWYILTETTWTSHPQSIHLYIVFHPNITVVPSHQAQVIHPQHVIQSFGHHTMILGGGGGGGSINLQESPFLLDLEIIKNCNWSVFVVVFKLCQGVLAVQRDFLFCFVWVFGCFFKLIVLQVSPQFKFFQNQPADLGSKTKTKTNPPTEKVLKLPPPPPPPPPPPKKEKKIIKKIEKGNKKNRTKQAAIK